MLLHLPLLPHLPLSSSIFKWLQARNQPNPSPSPSLTAIDHAQSLFRRCRRGRRCRNLPLIQQPRPHLRVSISLCLQLRPFFLTFLPNLPRVPPLLLHFLLNGSWALLRCSKVMIIQHLPQNHRTEHFILFHYFIQMKKKSQSPHMPVGRVLPLLIDFRRAQPPCFRKLRLSVVPMSYADFL
jgi:hypothetical protein